MKDKKGNKITEADRNLWDEVKKTAKPLNKTPAKPSLKLAKAQKIRENPTSRPPTPTPAKPSSIPRPHLHSAPLDEPTARKLAKGKLPIDGRLDLHGLTQSEAHDRLLGFLQAAHKSGKRIVLVITGKGQLGGGVLRLGVPRWLNEPVFREITSGYSEAHISHGGGGALYVRLRRIRK